MTRPRTLVLVVGTATDIGKTWITAALLTQVRELGISAVARKPVQSFDATATGPTDADILALAGDEMPNEVCPPHRWYGVAMAPPMAAEVIGVPQPGLSDLVSEIAWPQPEPGVGLVEGVGGVRSPVAADGDNCDLARTLEPDRTLLIADAGLGTIDSVRLAHSALRAAVDSMPVTVFLNRYDENDELHVRNVQWLAERDGFELETDLDMLTKLLVREVQS